MKCQRRLILVVWKCNRYNAGIEPSCILSNLGETITSDNIRGKKSFQPEFS